MENQKFIVKRYRHNQYWELSVIGGTFYVTVKDVLKYFGYASSSQRSITAFTKDHDRLLIKGGPIMKEFNNLTTSGMFLNLKALADFVYSRQEQERKDKGLELLKWLTDVPAPEMMNRYNKKFPGFGEQTVTVIPEKPQVDLFDADLQDRVKELEEKIEVYETVIDDLSEKFHHKLDHLWQTIDQLGKQMDELADAQAKPSQKEESLMTGIQELISKFGGDQRGNL